jgi:phage tail sheath gpL-like
MSISFNNIPANLRTPGTFIEFDNSRAQGGAINKKLLIIGQRLAATATVAVNTIVSVTNAAQAELYFGRGSMLAEMLKAALAARPNIEIWAIGLNDAGAGVQAVGSIEVTGPATATGTLYISIAGTRVAVAVTNADTDETIATAIVAAITADTTLPVTAAVNGGDATLVDLTCKWDGETGNTIDIRTQFIQGGNALNTAVPLTITAMNAGATNPAVADAITAMGDSWFHFIVTPYTDATNLTALETELDRRWGPLVQLASIAFTAFRGTQSATSTFGNTRNSHLVSCIGTGIAPQPPYLWASVNAVVGGNRLAEDPARQLRGLALTGIQPPEQTNVFTRDERQILLFDGIATYTVDNGGVVRLDRQITMYQTNTSSVSDDSYLDIMTPAANIEYRFRQVQVISAYDDYKLAEDDNAFGPGQPVMTPSFARAELLSLYRQLIGAALVEDYDSYADTLQIEIGDGAGDGDRNRLNVIDQPNFVNNLMIWAQQNQFRL